MTVKYQVFLSSTYEDLKVEREAVIRAVLEMGHIPVGMEMFSAADEEQWRIITRQIDQTDYYVVLSAHRYGSVVGGISYTEKEYDYAVSHGVPVLGFLINPTIAWPPHHCDTDPTTKEALSAFHLKLRQRPVGTWHSPTDLHGAVSIALMKAINSQPRPGWIRTPEAVGPQVTAEISRLSSENAGLRRQIEDVAARLPQEKEAELSQLISTLRGNKIDLHIWKRGAADWEPPLQKTLYWFFMSLAPELAVEKSTDEVAHYTAAIATQLKRSQLRETWPVPSNSIKAWFADLMSLDLVGPSPRKHSMKDTKEYWSLTSSGSSLYLSVRRRALERKAASQSQTDKGPSP